MVGGSEGLPYSAGASLTGEGGPLRVLPAAPWAVMFRDALAAARCGAGATDGRRVGVGVGGVLALGGGGTIQKAGDSKGVASGGILEAT